RAGRRGSGRGTGSVSAVPRPGGGRYSPPEFGLSSRPGDAPPQTMSSESSQPAAAPTRAGALGSACHRPMLGSYSAPSPNDSLVVPQLSHSPVGRSGASERPPPQSSASEPSQTKVDPVRGAS